MRFLTRYDGEVSEPLVGRQGRQISMRVARGIMNFAFFAKPYLALSPVGCREATGGRAEATAAPSPTPRVRGRDPTSLEAKTPPSEPLWRRPPVLQMAKVPA